MAENLEGCKLAALSLALTIITKNEDLTKRLIQYAEEANLYSLYEQALEDGIELSSVVKDALEKQKKHTAGLKSESNNIKFNGLIYAAILGEGNVRDVEVRELIEAIWDSSESAAAALEVIDLASKTDISGIAEIAKVMGGTEEAAQGVVKMITEKTSKYTGANYSLATEKAITNGRKETQAIKKQLEKAQKLRDNFATMAKNSDKDEKTLLKEMKEDVEKRWNEKGGLKKKYVALLGLDEKANTGQIKSKIREILQADASLDELTKKVDDLKSTYKQMIDEDIEAILRGQNPFAYAKADEEWKVIKDLNNTNDERLRQYGQYVLAKTMLSDASGEIPQGVYNEILKSLTDAGGKVTNTLPELTEDWILSGDRTLEELLSRAYTNTQQLISNGQLRDMYRQRLISLATDGDLTLDDVQLIETFINTTKMAEAGIGFSSVFRRVGLVTTAKNMGLNISNTDGTKLFNGIKKLLGDKNFETIITQGTTFEIYKGLEVTSGQLLELCCSMLGDLNLYKAIASNKWTDDKLIEIAGAYLSNNITEGNKRFMALLTAVKESPTTDDVRGVVLKAITGRDVPKGTHVTFFDINQQHTLSTEQRAREKFFDRLAEGNSIVVDEGITSLNAVGATIEEELNSSVWENGGFIIVNNAGWKSNKDLHVALKKVNAGRDKDKMIQVLFPEGGMTSSFSIDGTKLIFKTTDTGMFNEFLYRTSIRTLGKTNVDSKITAEVLERINKGDATAVVEYNKSLTEDAIAYYSQMLGTPADTDNVFKVLEDITGMSFKNYDSIADKKGFWKKVDASVTLGERVTGKTTRKVVNVSDVIKEINGMTAEDIAAELTKKYGFQIKPEQLVLNGKLNENIKNAYTNFRLSGSVEEYLQNKGRLLAMINGGTGDILSFAEFKGMLQTGNFDSYKKIFFNDAEMSDAEFNKYINKINDMIFDNLAMQVTNSLINLGYSIPGAINIKEALYDYLMGNLQANIPYVQAFLYKNGLQDSDQLIRSIFDSVMPKEFDFRYDDTTVIHFNELVNQGGQAYFTSFDFSFVGSGEGYKSWGWGGYVTLSRPGRSDRYARIANRNYRKRNTTVKGMHISETPLSDDQAYYVAAGDKEHAIKLAKDDAEREKKQYESLLGGRTLEELKQQYGENSYIVSEILERKENEAKAIRAISYIQTLEPSDVKYPFLETFRGENAGYWKEQYEKASDMYETSSNIWISMVSISPWDTFEEWLKRKKTDKYFNELKNKEEIIDFVKRNFKKYQEDESFREEIMQTRNRDWEYMNEIEDYYSYVRHPDLYTKKYVLNALKDLDDSQLGRRTALNEILKDIESKNASGRKGYFYKIEIPDVIKTGANTPTGANYIFALPGGLKNKLNRLTDEQLLAFNTELNKRLAGTAGESYLLHYRAENMTQFDLYYYIADAFRVAGMGYDKEASLFLSDLGYKGLHYHGKQDGYCFVMYKESDMDILAIYDNESKTRKRIKEGLDENDPKFLRDASGVPFADGYDRGELADNFERAADDAYNGDDDAEYIENFLSRYLFNPTKGTKEEYLNKLSSLLNKHTNDITGYMALYVIDNFDKIFDVTKQVKNNWLTQFKQIIKEDGTTGWGINAGTDLVDTSEALLETGFRKKDTIKRIAEVYGIPIEIAGTVLKDGDDIALGVTNWIVRGETPVSASIKLQQQIASGTASHELFHGIFAYVDGAKREEIINEAMKLYGMSEKEVHEMLADKFTEYFKTGTLSLPKDEKSFVGKVKEIFKKIADWLRGVTEYEGKVKQLYDDMLDLKYANQQDNVTVVKDRYEGGYRNVVEEIENPLWTGDTYSALGSMTLLKNGVTLPNAGSEREILEGILNKYYSTIEQKTAKGELTFAEAQRLKMQAGYALDMFEQDYLMPKYKRFLSPSEKNEMFGLKYQLGLGLSSGDLETVANYNKRILDRFDASTRTILDNNNKFIKGFVKNQKSEKAELEARQEELIRQGATLKEINGTVAVIDIKDELVEQLENIPNTILGLEEIKSLGRGGIEQLSNEQAYFLLNVVELAKNADTRTNYVMQTLYKMKPQLGAINFFQSYRVVDGVPKALTGNLLNTKFLSKFSNTNTFDVATKKSILEGIKNEFGHYGKMGGNVFKDKKGKVKETATDALERIIKGAIDRNVNELGNVVNGSDLKKFKEEALMVYMQSFNPYTMLEDVPAKVRDNINTILKEKQKGLTEAIEKLGDTDMFYSLLDRITVVSKDGSVMTLKDVMGGGTSNMSKLIFDSDDNIIRSADKNAQKFIDPTWRPSVKAKREEENKRLAEEAQNNYQEGLQAYLNESQLVSVREKQLRETILMSARGLVEQYSTTKKFSETDYALAGVNDEIIRDLQNDVIGFRGMISDGRWNSEGIYANWEKVKEYYNNLYNLTPEQLKAYKPKDVLENAAYNMVNYFKEMERRLGSADGITGVSADVNINKAFFHIGQVVGNIHDMGGIFSLMSGIEGNQFLKFFRFATPQDACYVEKLRLGGLSDDFGLLGGWRKYIDKTDSGLDYNWFNTTFATNFDNDEYQLIIQSLTGNTIINRKWQIVHDMIRGINHANWLTRFATTYPFGLLTIGNQSIAYFLKQIGWEKEIGMEDLGTTDRIRENLGILSGEFNELEFFKYANPDNKSPDYIYNLYGLPDIEDVYQNVKLYSTDDTSVMYSKLDEYFAGKMSTKDRAVQRIHDLYAQFKRNTDAYKDNANNIIDGLFARNFKNIAFEKGLLDNGIMKFASAQQFADFLAGEAPEYLKKKAVDAVRESSGRNFKNMLGSGFGGLDRSVGGGAASNFFTGLMNTVNFRGAWGRNILRQTSDYIVTLFNIAKSGISPEALDAAIDYVTKTPEFVNFSHQLFQDFINCWKLDRYTDNGQRNPAEDEYSFMDFISYTYENAEFLSQTMQGLESYGVSRILLGSLESMVQSYLHPDVYKDTYGIGALLNGISQNVGRNWKAYKFMAGALAQLPEWGTDGVWAYLENEWWKMSAGSLRYIINEDMNKSGYNTELITGNSPIPAIFTGQADKEGDKQYSFDIANTEAWMSAREFFKAIASGDGDAAMAYNRNNWVNFLNTSQLGGFIKNSVKGLYPILGDWDVFSSTADYMFGVQGGMSNPYELAEMGDAFAQTDIGKSLMNGGMYVPTDPKDVEIMYKQILYRGEHRPGNNAFNKGMFNYEQFGHIGGTEYSDDRDLNMEFLLKSIKYERGINYEFKKDEKGNLIETEYWKNHMKRMNDHANDSDYMTASNFNFIWNWVEQNREDPNYMLYSSLIAEGVAANYLEKKSDEIKDGYNALNGLKKDAKLTEDEEDRLLYSHIIPTIQSLKVNENGKAVPFLEAIMKISQPAREDAWMAIASRQLGALGDRELVEKFFKVKENKDGGVTVDLSVAFKNYILEQGKLANYLQAGDIDSFVAETSSITNVYKKNDPTGLLTTVQLTSRINRINDAKALTPEQKAIAINTLLTDNYDFIQQHIPEFIDELGDAAKGYIDNMNKSLYDISEIGTTLVKDAEADNSKTGSSAARSIASIGNKLLSKLAKGTSTELVKPKKYDYNYIPIKFNAKDILKATGGQGYVPKTPGIVLQQYKPHSDFSISKDVQRRVKNTQTKEISKTKQLSNIETKTSEAMSAEA